MLRATQTKNKSGVIPATRSLRATARLLRVNPGHLSRVLRGERVSRSLMDRYHKLKIAAAILFITWSSAAAPISDTQAVRAIVGEAANQGRVGMLAVAGAIRNRGTLRGVYGVKNPIADKQPAWVWERARTAWASSATNDITHGATHWENFSAFGKPRWAGAMTVTTNIGAHTFMKEGK